MRVDTGDLVTLAQFAEELEVSQPAVANWRRRHADFPDPVWTDGNRLHLFLRWQVEAWVRAHPRVGSTQPARTPTPAPPAPLSPLGGHHSRLLAELSDARRMAWEAGVDRCVLTIDESYEVALRAAIGWAAGIDPSEVGLSQWFEYQAIRLILNPWPTVATLRPEDPDDSRFGTVDMAIPRPDDDTPEEGTG